MFVCFDEIQIISSFQMSLVHYSFSWSNSVRKYEAKSSDSCGLSCLAKQTNNLFVVRNINLVPLSSLEFKIFLKVNEKLIRFIVWVDSVETKSMKLIGLFINSHLYWSNLKLRVNIQNIRCPLFIFGFLSNKIWGAYRWSTICENKLETWKGSVLTTAENLMKPVSVQLGEPIEIL